MLRTIDRILAVSDIHGENRKFLYLLEKVEYDPDKDLLIICGDMIDRGEENLDTLATCEKLQKQGAIMLKGNHEQFLVEALMEMVVGDAWRSHPSLPLNIWINKNGGASLFYEIKDLSKEKSQNILSFTQALPLYFTCGDFIFSHAGANVSKPIEINTEDELVWMDESFPNCPAYFDKIMIFGHVPTWLLYPYDKKFKKQDAKIWYDRVNKDKVGIDCGGIFGGRLAALELPSYREFYV